MYEGHKSMLLLTDKFDIHGKTVLNLNLINAVMPIKLKKEALED